MNFTMFGSAYAWTDAGARTPFDIIDKWAGPFSFNQRASEKNLGHLVTEIIKKSYGAHHAFAPFTQPPSPPPSLFFFTGKNRRGQKRATRPSSCTAAYPSS